MTGAVRCAVCGLTIKWGQERQIRDPQTDRPALRTVCPVCAIESGQWATGQAVAPR